MAAQVDRRWLLRTLIAPALGMALPSLAQAPSPFTGADLAHAAALRERGLGSELAYALTDSLVTQVGARPAGSDADARAVAWAVSQLQQLGFSNVRAEPVALLAWQRGATTAQIVGPQVHTPVVAALGNSVGTVQEGIEADIAYYPDFPSLRADTSGRAKGRIVFIDQQIERTRDGSGYSAAFMARFAGAVEAARRGAVAVAIRSLGTDRDRIAHTGSLRYDPRVERIPAVALSVPDADLVRAWNGAGATVRMRLKIEQGAHLQGTSHNVIAEVPGGDLAHEIVLLGAHLDSWDITPGAQDDASGVGIVTAAAKVLLEAGRKPRRTVRVVLFANEENGFDGANAYADKYKDVVHQLLGESDFGAARIWRMQTRVRPDALPVFETIAAQLAPLAITFEGNEGAPSPDAGVLMRKRGWPAIDLTQDGTRYFDVHHSAADTMDKIDPATMPYNVAAWAVVAWLAAQSDVRFGPVTP